MYRFGFCGWLLHGISLPDKIEFLANAGFSSISWLQSVMNADEIECAEAAAAIREKNFALAYHGNVHNNLTAEMKPDQVFVRKMFDNVMWWHTNTNGVVSCCSDTLTAEQNGAKVYLKDETFRLFRTERDFFEPVGIGYGIENSFNGKYCTIEEMRKAQEQLGEAPRAGMIFDVGHAHVHLTQSEQKMSLADYIREIPFHIYEVHVTDNHGTADEHLLPGMGNIDFQQMRAGLEQRGFDGVISLEVCPDIIHGVYGWDLAASAGRDMVLRARDSFFKMFGI